MRISWLRLSLVLGAALPSGNALAEPYTNPQKPQYVLISFDGAGPLPQWERSMALGARTGARFTYFLSCVNALPNSLSGHYRMADGRAGKSNVGFGGTKADVEARLLSIWRAAGSGHEIANHACGHFDGKNWSKADWLAEFDAFDAIMTNAFAAIGSSQEPQGWRAFAANKIKGFRAPYLSVNKALYEALSAHGFAYDASGTEREISTPRRGTLTRFALPFIPEGPAQRRIIAMDYNLFVRHSGGFERAEGGAEFEERTYAALHQAFDRQYDGNRKPLQIGMHFTLMNGGAYWRAMERLVTDVCAKPDVRCTSYAQYLKETAPVPLGVAKAELGLRKGGS
jgi:peptidoglycan/xylan/chitin deacetylase (PgdA/CDA1 family)